MIYSDTWYEKLKSRCNQNNPSSGSFLSNCHETGILIRHVAAEVPCPHHCKWSPPAPFLTTRFKSRHEGAASAKTPTFHSGGRRRSFLFTQIAILLCMISFFKYNCNDLLQGLSQWTIHHWKARTMPHSSLEPNPWHRAQHIPGLSLRYSHVYIMG